MKNWYHVGAYSPPDGTLGAPYFRPLIPASGNRPIAATANRRSVRYPFQIYFSINGHKPTASDVSTWTSMNAYEVKVAVQQFFGTYCGGSYVKEVNDALAFSIPTTCSGPGRLVRAELLRNVGGSAQRVAWDVALGDWRPL